MNIEEEIKNKEAMTQIESFCESLKGSVVKCKKDVVDIDFNTLIKSGRVYLIVHTEYTNFGYDSTLPKVHKVELQIKDFGSEDIKRIKLIEYDVTSLQFIKQIKSTFTVLC